SVLPVIRADRARLNRVELPPFREAVKDGVGMVMVAHLMVPALDPEKPTTFSKKTVTALLREGMEFDGLIVSDALDMGALAGSYPQDEIAVRAVEAGMDILLHPSVAQTAIDAVVAAVDQGRLSRVRISESVERITAAKMKLGLFDEPMSRIRVDYEKHGRIAQKIGRQAIRVLSGDRKIFPFPQQAGVACFVLDDDNNTESGNVFIHALRDNFRNLSVMVLTPGSEMAESLAQDSIRAADFIVLAFLSRISASKGRSGIADKLREQAMSILAFARDTLGKTVIISFDSPYLLDRFPEADVRIAAYDRTKEIQIAAAKLLTGE
ncbi:MAG TPA: glycoside hydrolase family 3 N-terminal domain-containing protein, partial [Nitrospirota bacterium]|nr:glycoside hydrolase family 3 N-terminal domain-containing protein [Nitrospirota bacterium]